MGRYCLLSLTSYGPLLSLKSYKLWATTVSKSYKLWAATVTEVSQVIGPYCHWNLTSYGPLLSLKSYTLWATTVTKVWQVMGHYCHTQDLKITSCQFYCHTRCTSHFPIKIFVTHIIYFLYYVIGLIVIHVFWISFGVFFNILILFAFFFFASLCFIVHFSTLSFSLGAHPSLTIKARVLQTMHW